MHSRAPAWLALLETLGIAELFLALGTLLCRADPFLLRLGFSWLALAPILAGLRHGAAMGVLGGAALGAALALAGRAGLADPANALELTLGWLAVGLLAGEFGDAWRRRGRALEAAVADLELRLERLSREHRALEASHERLERQLPGDPATLKDALDGLGRILEDHVGRDVLAALGNPILRLFAEHAFVQSGSLHPLGADGKPRSAVASLGAGGAREDDPLLLAAATSGEVTSVRERGEGSDLLAAVPLVDATGRAHAVVAIRDMPFVSLHDRTLALLAVIGGRLGDAIAQAETARGPRALPPPGSPTSSRKRQPSRAAPLAQGVAQGLHAAMSRAAPSPGAKEKAR